MAPSRWSARAHARGADLETVFEREDFLERVAGIFAALERPYLERLDASGPPEDVEARTWNALARHLGLTL